LIPNPIDRFLLSALWADANYFASKSPSLSAELSLVSRFFQVDSFSNLPSVPRGNHHSTQTRTHVRGVKRQSFADIFKGKNPVAVCVDYPFPRFMKNPSASYTLCEAIILKALNGIF
jgi:hypothetical protein